MYGSDDLKEDNRGMQGSMVKYDVKALVQPGSNLESTVVDTCYGPVGALLFKRLAAVKLVALDVDGTLTDGGIYLDAGDGEYKKFNTRDGLGISCAIKRGLLVCVITGRSSNLTKRRMDEVGIEILLQGQTDKKKALEKVMREHNLKKDEVAAFGDDLNDEPMFAAAGIRGTPNDAHPYMKKIADIVVTRKGGHGAVREFIDLILMSQDKLPLTGGPF